MGVLYDYFRAPSDDAAIALIGEIGGGPVVVADSSRTVDAVDLKGIDPGVALGSLVGFVRGVHRRKDLVRSDLLWSLDEQGPWLLSIDDDTRDALAAITDDQVPALSAQWGRIEELASDGPLPGGQLIPVINAISGLAGRARDAGDHLYCWCCL